MHLVAALFEVSVLCSSVYVLSALVQKQLAVSIPELVVLQALVPLLTTNAEKMPDSQA